MIIDRPPGHGCRGRSEEIAFDEPTDQMLDGQMRLLNMLGVRARYRDGDIRQAGERTTGPGENHRTKTRASGVFDGQDHVGGIAAGADPDQDVAGTTQGLDLPLEYAVEPAI